MRTDRLKRQPQAAAGRKRSAARPASQPGAWTAEVLAAARAFRSIMAGERAPSPARRRSASIGRAVRAYYLG